MAKSVMDYIFRWLALKFLQREERNNVGLISDQVVDEQPKATPKSTGKSNGAKNGVGRKVELASSSSFSDHEKEIFLTQSDAPPCPDCGALTVRSGACYKCLQCGTSLGCS
jgi:ribonucleoside-diphosphate reductase alpha chain